MSARASFLALLLAAALPVAGPASAEVSKVVLPAAREVSLPNGARILLAEEHDLPLIAFEGYLRGGSITDPPGKEGIASLTAEMLRKGAGRRSAREIAAALDGAGADLSISAGIEATTISGEFMARDQALLIDLLRSLLREPAFPDTEFTKLRDQTVEALRAEKDDPQSMLSQYAAAFFYGSHPYGRPVAGDESTVAKLTRADVLACYRDNYGGDRLLLAIVGDFDARAMEAKIRSAFGEWPKAAAALPEIPVPARLSGRRVLLVDKPDATQTYFWIGNRGIARTDPDRVLIDVVNTAFGGRYTSMINTALRLKSGLTYGARCRLARLSKPGSVAIVSFTKTATTQKAIDLALATLDRLHAGGLDEAALHSAKQYIEGQYPTAFETRGQVADKLADLAYYGLPPTEATEYPERVESVRSVEALRPIIERVYPKSVDVTIVLVGNAKAIRPAIRRYGKVVELSIDRPLVAGVHEAKGPAAR